MTLCLTVRCLRRLRLLDLRPAWRRRVPPVHVSLGILTLKKPALARPRVLCRLWFLCRRPLVRNILCCLRMYPLLYRTRRRRCLLFLRRRVNVLDGAVHRGFVRLPLVRWRPCRMVTRCLAREMYRYRRVWPVPFLKLLLLARLRSGIA